MPQTAGSSVSSVELHDAVERIPAFLLRSMMLTSSAASPTAGDRRRPAATKTSTDPSSADMRSLEMPDGFDDSRGTTSARLGVPLASMDGDDRRRGSAAGPLCDLAVAGA